MKKTTFILLLMFCASQFTPAQKIYLDYKLRTADNTYQLKANALSDEIIQLNSDTLTSIIKTNKDVISIEDNTNRKFERIILRDAVYYPKVLNEGYFKLYELKLNDKPTYIVYSEKDTIVIEKKDSLVDNAVVIDRKYNNKLVYLSADYPELWKDAGQVDFDNKDFQKFISVLNTKKGGAGTVRKEKNIVRFLTFKLEDCISELLNQTDISASITKYHLDFSSDISFRYGLRVGTINGLRADALTNAKVFQIPLQINYEKTNSKSTPFFNAGFIPTFTRGEYGMVVFPDASAGWKFKLTNGFNIVSGVNYFLLTSLAFTLGVEYSLQL